MLGRLQNLFNSSDYTRVEGIFNIRNDHPDGPRLAHAQGLGGDGQRLDRSAANRAGEPRNRVDIEMDPAAQEISTCGSANNSARNRSAWTCNSPISTESLENEYKAGLSKAE